MTYYVLNEGDNKFESMTKEQILAAIEQAVSTGQIKDVDTGFVTTIKEVNHQQGLKFWYGTMAEFNALGSKQPNTFYIFSDDTTLQDIENQFQTNSDFHNYVNVELGNLKKYTDIVADSIANGTLCADMVYFTSSVDDLSVEEEALSVRERLGQLETKVNKINKVFNLGTYNITLNGSQNITLTLSTFNEIFEATLPIVQFGISTSFQSIISMCNFHRVDNGTTKRINFTTINYGSTSSTMYHVALEATGASASGKITSKTISL